MIATLRAFLRTMGLITIIATMPWAQIFVILFMPKHDMVIPVYFHRWALWLMGVKVRVHGAPSTNPSTLYIGNHSSYFDILVLGSLMRTSFIAKHEIAEWPVFGWLAQLQRCIFIQRDRQFAHQQTEIIRTRLQRGDNLVLFAEGTTSDGNRVLPFRSSLFEVAYNAETVQPISIVFTLLDGIPAGRTNRPLYAWYGDMYLVPHLWDALKQGDMTVDVLFHDAVNPHDFAKRKLLSDHCHNAIADGVSRLVQGTVANDNTAETAQQITENAA